MIFEKRRLRQGKIAKVSAGDGGRGFRRFERLSGAGFLSLWGQSWQGWPALSACFNIVALVVLRQGFQRALLVKN